MFAVYGGERMLDSAKSSVKGHGTPRFCSRNNINIIGLATYIDEMVELWHSKGPPTQPLCCKIYITK